MSTFARILVWGVNNLFGHHDASPLLLDLGEVFDQTIQKLTGRFCGTNPSTFARILDKSREFLFTPKVGSICLPRKWGVPVYPESWEYLFGHHDAAPLLLDLGEVFDQRAQPLQQVHGVLR